LVPRYNLENFIEKNSFCFGHHFTKGREEEEEKKKHIYDFEIVMVVMMM
jgi:hypothetical protein